MQLDVTTQLRYRTESLAVWHALHSSMDLRNPELDNEIGKDGLIIPYKFGVQEGKGHMNFYSSHCRTNQGHERVWEDGRDKIVGLCGAQHTDQAAGESS